MKLRFTIFLIFVLFLVSTVFAQENTNQGLILRGRYYDTDFERKEDHIIYKGKLAMEFVNKGDKPIILLNPQGQFGQWQSKAYFSDEPDFETSKRFKFTTSVERKLVNPDQLKNLVAFLSNDEPPANSVVIIKPDDSLLFDDEFEYKQTFHKVKYETIYDGLNIPEFCCYFQTKPIKDLKYFKIKYEFSAVQYQADADLLENMQTKWRKYGFLPVDVNGGFSIVSELLFKW
ncbi:MAG: hypothetical protein LUM44_14360 [Pyrinomonadaceae bacterium]|nr:hypothetical protein [Pyrinomonadaceae bacterium]